MNRQTYTGNAVLVEEWDEQAGTYTLFNPDRTVRFQRPLTPAEAASLVDPPAPIVPAADELDAAAEVAEASTLADVRALATSLRAAASALRGAP